MGWIYRQVDGWILDPLGARLAQGYSGAFGGKNNPDMQTEPMIGPIPRGVYEIGSPEDTIDHGPYAMRLEPSGDNQMFGRMGFLIHGDSIQHPGDASEGCIILSRPARESIWNSGDHVLQVVSGRTLSTDPELGL